MGPVCIMHGAPVVVARSNKSHPGGFQLHTNPIVAYPRLLLKSGIGNAGLDFQAKVPEISSGFSQLRYTLGIAQMP